jgi:hypothetical protein
MNEQIRLVRANRAVSRLRQRFFMMLAMRQMPRAATLDNSRFLHTRSAGHDPSAVVPLCSPKAGAMPHGRLRPDAKGS